MFKVESQINILYSNYPCFKICPCFKKSSSI